MPTLYTALRAQHRHAPPLPKKLPSYRSHASLAVRRAQLSQHFTPSQQDYFRSSPGRKVIVVGAGLAGLCAAYELKQLGYAVSVYEARHRVGGRAFSFRFARNKIVEGGGELIGLNHPLWCGYARSFGLKFSDVLDYGNSPVRFGGKTLTYEEAKKLTDAMEPHMESLNHLADSIVNPHEPWLNMDSVNLDRTSLAHWLASLKCRSKQSRDGRDALEQQLVADNGRVAREQSLLGVLAMVKGHGVDRYWVDTEVYRCVGGNAQLAAAFVERLGKNVVHTGVTVKSISEADGKVTVQLARTTDEELEKDFEPRLPPRRRKSREISPAVGDDVILAVPPSVWGHIRFENQDLHDKLCKPPQLGVNTKNLFALKSRFWQDFASSPTLTDSNGPADITWETTEDLEVEINQVRVNEEPQFSFVAFSGATHSEKLVELSSDRARTADLLQQLRVVYPGIEKQIAGSKFMNWPEKHFSRGSYYFPAPKEVLKWGPFWKNGYGGWLHFAGEHTSYAFMGYMEGALSSAFRLVHRLAIRDKLLP